MKWLCRWFDHRWKQRGVSDIYRCARCGAVDRAGRTTQ